MSKPTAVFYFDFVDPISYLVSLELARALRPEEDVVWSPFEIRPPPHPLTSIDDPTLADRWRLARDAATELDVRLTPPMLLPWSRKSHELHFFARTAGLGEVVRAAIFETYFSGEGDVGRVDVLVDIARSAGLDPTETKAVLDVDRFEEGVRTARSTAESVGIRDAPVLTVGSARLEGFHNRTTLGTFLRDTSPGAPNRTIRPAP